MSRALFAAAATALLMSATPVFALQTVEAAQVLEVAPEAAEAASVVDAFHAALEAGDTASALTFMAEDVMIFEEGGAERSRDEYASHHLQADASYAAASESTMTRRAGWVDGDVAWITSEGSTTGQAGNSATTRLTVETMVLKRGQEGWRIQHIHWSSRAAPAA
ncbi:MAG: nuclear transport factor 2 family protein [Alphaproteobacteria bacterium]|jgi:ketosteroid isomerase-like protein|uniref:Nuclear transport factor 2 family protein n=1 Tax=Brevundimonas aurifodinae TaxID=1508312 RepID=A0ABV1NLW4_9CAUL|nr:nuclear transport factor 2 family protein [Alphaproteobacteria bacterium]MBU2042399.1 nuclear transport factor 2 family protein [Alphaproteobacteria bacterium]MBU2125576.1 nuclear transport factor 2 family protein [Alphaproteobacteria bacterium]MBU2209422.1 nuclear transport factor 2 family protein [Alphaproteobacteria bacterium]MBU2291470.1 nuclear transport factor 2 family protein [Alphaproteobacteria bacterium]